MIEQREPETPAPGPLSVGRVAEETGIQPGTLRMWERRYGRPRPVRLPSGHRRFPPEEVRFLRRVVEAMALGYRPSDLLSGGEERVAEVLSRHREPQERDERIVRWLGHAREFEEDRLRDELRDSIRELGVVRAMDARFGPFLTAVGSAWADGRLDVRHEHFSSRLVEGVLESWRAAAVRERGARPYGPGLALATCLPGEQHHLGLAMIACACEALDWRVRVLGPDTPMDDISGAVPETGATVLTLTVSSNYGVVRSDAAVAALREAIPEDVMILVGGQGVLGRKRRRRGVRIVHDLASLQRWLTKLRPESP